MRSTPLTPQASASAMTCQRQAGHCRPARTRRRFSRRCSTCGGAGGGSGGGGTGAGAGSGSRRRRAGPFTRPPPSRGRAAGRRCTRGHRRGAGS
ncbi:hypothetical protein PP1_000055 [Pseudonocardia sp. P1]